MWSLRRPGTLPGAAELEAVTAAGDHSARAVVANHRPRCRPGAVFEPAAVPNSMAVAFAGAAAGAGPGVAAPAAHC